MLIECFPRFFRSPIWQLLIFIAHSGDFLLSPLPLGKRGSSGNRLSCCLLLSLCWVTFARLVSCLVARLICRHFNCLARCLTLICALDLHMNSHHEVDYVDDDDDVSLRWCCCHNTVLSVQCWARQLTEIYGVPYALDQHQARLLLHPLIVLAALRIRRVCVPSLRQVYGA